MVTIPEGRWKSEVFAILAKASGKPVADYETAAKDATALGLPASAKGNVEGYLFPATYEFAKDSSPTEQLRQMVQKAVATLSTPGRRPGRHGEGHHHREHPRGRGSQHRGPREAGPGHPEPARRRA